MKRYKVKYRKLGREFAFGLSHTENDLIELDERIKGKKHLEVLVHECLHLLYPHLEEDEVIRDSIRIIKTLWGEGYRRTEQGSSHELQTPFE